MEKIQFSILAFGIVKDIVGGASFDLAIEDGATVAQLKSALLNQYPAFGRLNSLAVAVNNEYAKDDRVIKSNDEVVLIPPVSGG